MLGRFRLAATPVDRIPKGARPEHLPTEQPTAFELANNFKPRKRLGSRLSPQNTVDLQGLVSRLKRRIGDTT